MTQLKDKSNGNAFIPSAPGSVLDWVYGEAGIRFSYSVSLRDTGTVRHSPPVSLRVYANEDSSMAIFFHQV